MNLTKLVVIVALTVALATITGQYVATFLSPQLAYWLLYFIAAKEIINRSATKDGNS